MYYKATQRKQRVLDKAEYSAFESTLSSHIVSYRKKHNAEK